MRFSRDYCSRSGFSRPYYIANLRRKVSSYVETITSFSTRTLSFGERVVVSFTGDVIASATRTLSHAGRTVTSVVKAIVDSSQRDLSFGVRTVTSHTGTIITNAWRSLSISARVVTSYTGKIIGSVSVVRIVSRTVVSYVSTIKSSAISYFWGKPFLQGIITKSDDLIGRKKK